MSELEQSYSVVQALVADFEAHRNAFLKAEYSESQLRADFLNKFLESFGWDVGHVRQKNPFKQEAKIENPVDDRGAKRRADYAFFISPNFRDPRLFLEAKKPYITLANKDHYFQAIRYGWHSQNPLVVISNFHQAHILDCRSKPDIDTALERVVKRYSLADLATPDKFAELYYLLSREAVGLGSLEDFAEALPRPRGKAIQRGLFRGGYQRIDLTFLRELEDHREGLARSFKRTNPDLDGYALTEITQRVLDRLIFIRFLEDKLIEPGNLVSRFGSKGSTWGDFIRESRRLDSIYNGIVFKRHGLIDATDFAVDEAVFGDICEALAHINSPYDFNSIPIHILGSIYERFLGRIITDEGKIVEKPDVRKAGGVYYTPEYVVQYIVRQTVGKLISGKSPSQIARMRFCDIACGSGSAAAPVFWTVG